MNKVEQAIKIICDLGFPTDQQNERSALTLLALLNLKKEKEWNEIENSLWGIKGMMDWFRDFYDKDYAPNSRETIRRFTLHQFVDGGLCLLNPDNPSRPVNSPHTCYQISPEALILLKTYNMKNWNVNLTNWKLRKKSLIDKYSMGRNQKKVPLKISTELEILLSPGEHSKLIKNIVEDFGPRFTPNAKLVYLGDTGSKEDFFDNECLENLKVFVDKKGKLPDVILYLEEKNWLILIESVTSHGPVDGKRYGELNKLFADSLADLVFVTAFPDRKTMGKYLTKLSWETEVWLADSPSHMIHFNGDKFLGPYEKK